MKFLKKKSRNFWASSSLDFVGGLGGLQQLLPLNALIRNSSHISNLLNFHPALGTLEETRLKVKAAHARQRQGTVMTLEPYNI